MALLIDWGDGSTPEVLSLSAGSTSFSLSHTYADDDPTGTALDTYPIALSIADDEGDTGTGSASGVVYDNMIGYPKDMDGANPQAIGGGSIVIHNK